VVDKSIAALGVQIFPVITFMSVKLLHPVNHELKFQPEVFSGKSSPHIIFNVVQDPNSVEGLFASRKLIRGISVVPQ
jgi:hypothetical protein